MSENFKVPLSRPNITEDEKTAINRVLETNWLSQGEVTNEFEKLLSDYFHSDCIAVNNGSSALMAALLAHKIKPGDRVLVPDLTFIATSSVPKILGAKIMVCDIDPQTLNISLEKLENIVKKNDIKFVIIVDVVGLPNDLDRIIDLSKRYNFTLIEDAAQGFGSEYNKRKLGSYDHLTVFSFQIAKQITTIEGGCIASTNSSLLKKIRKIKDYGRSGSEQYVHDVVGTNFRINDLQSAIGIQQLKKVDVHLENRNKIANLYKEKIKGLTFQKIPEYVTRHSYLFFLAIAENGIERKKFLAKLRNNSIDARKIWTPIHSQPCNLELNKFNCENSSEIFGKAFILPIYNDMSLNEANIVVNSFD